MTLREKMIEAVRVKIDPSAEGNFRIAFNKAADAIRAMPYGIFADEGKTK